MLSGIDISHWEWDLYKNGKLDLKTPDFIILKATEGKTYYDSYADYFLSMIDRRRQMYGFYHYAHPESNTPQQEVYNFLSHVSQHIGNALFALDVEGKALNLNNRDLSKWVLTFIRTFQRETGVKPLIYTGTEGLQKIGRETLAEDVGLWFARYRRSIDKSMYSPYPFYAIWQYTETPYDKNFFNGTVRQWKKYCERRSHG